MTTGVDCLSIHANVGGTGKAGLAKKSTRALVTSRSFAVNMFGERIRTDDT